MPRITRTYTPGEEPTTADVEPPTIAEQREQERSASVLDSLTPEQAAAVRALLGGAPAPAAEARELPDPDTVDTSKIPYGKAVLTRAGWLCSTAEPPAPRVRMVQ